MQKRKSRTSAFRRQRTLSRCRARRTASWWETLRIPQEKMPQREAYLAGGYIATRLADGKSVRFKRMK
jgi:hypothetical protein